MTTAIQKQFRKDTATNLNAATPANGEPGWDTTNKRLVVGDGSTAGGIKIPSAKDIQNQAFQYSTVGGTGDAITLTNTPAVGALAAGQKIRFKATADNTTAVTIATDGLTAKDAKYMINGALAALPAGAIKSGAIIEGDYDGTQYQITSGLNLIASSSTFGLAKVDGTSITASGGVLSAGSTLMTPLAVGAIILAGSGSNQNPGDTVGGGSLVVYTLSTSGAAPTSGDDSLSGTWKALQHIRNTTFGLWQRTA